MLFVMILDGLGHRESTVEPLDGQFRHRTAAEKIISDSKLCYASAVSMANVSITKSIAMSVSWHP